MPCLVQVRRSRLDRVGPGLAAAGRDSRSDRTELNRAAGAAAGRGLASRAESTRAARGAWEAAIRAPAAGEARGDARGPSYRDLLRGFHGDGAL